MLCSETFCILWARRKIYLVGAKLNLNCIIINPLVEYVGKDLNNVFLFDFFNFYCFFVIAHHLPSREIFM
jgi:hypothetical protein